MKANQLSNTIKNKYWDKSKGLYADRTEKDAYSQHANLLSILTNLISKSEAGSLSKKIMSDKNLAPTSIYFKYYLHQALVKAGLGNDYVNWLDKWRENIAYGLTTWAEISDIDIARSDCHAWGSSPNIEFYRTVLGIDSDALGFAKVKIVPHLGKYTDINGSIPHPKGEIHVRYKKNENKWNVEINLPNKIDGTLHWKGKVIKLKSGKNILNLN
jgi:hypothetical protein